MSILQSAQEKAYNAYIREHQHNIGIAWRLIRPRFNNGPEFQKKMDRIISVHDVSKFSREEFPGYRATFFPAETDVRTAEVFDLAWNHHQKANPHHWEYWVTADGRALPMSPEAALEMVCDWAAMELKYNGNLLAWYVDHRSRMKLHPNTIAEIHKHIAEMACLIQDYRAGGLDYANKLPLD